MSQYDAWVQTHQGHQLYPFNIGTDAIDIIDIAHSLSMQCRFNGHVWRFFSVAQHSINASYCVPPEFALEALLHDAAEYVVGDLPSPIKHHLPEFSELEHRIEYAIRVKFALSTDISALASVKRADHWLVHEEASRLLLSDLSEHWTLAKPNPDVEPPALYWETLEPAVARELFLLRYAELVALRTQSPDDPERAVGETNVPEREHDADISLAA